MKMKEGYALLVVFGLLISVTLGRNAVMNLLSSCEEYSQISFITSNGTANSFDLRNSNNGTTSVFRRPKEEPVIAFESFDKMTVNGKLVLNSSNVDFLLTFEDSHIEYEGVDQWTLVSVDDFQGEAPGWSEQSFSTCGTNSNMFLGGHCIFGGISATKTFTGLKRHSMIRVTANYHFFDLWEGEEAYMQVDNRTVWAENYAWCDKVLTWKCKRFGLNACGADYPDRLGVPIDFIIHHSDESFVLTFGSTLKKSPCIASWGIDDVSIYIR